jgi:hypothetical protein
VRWIFSSLVVRRASKKKVELIVVVAVAVAVAVPLHFSVQRKLFVVLSIPYCPGLLVHDSPPILFGT